MKSCSIASTSISSANGYIARGGQIVDATIVAVPRQRNTREENEAVKSGRTPAAWEKKPAKNRQKDKDARWTKKHGRSFYGYKNHVNADAKHKLIRRYDVSDAAVHDSQKLDALLNKANTSADVFADSAYRSAETEARLKARGFRSRIHVRATRNHPLSQRQEEANRKKSRDSSSHRACVRSAGDFSREAGSCGRSASSERERRSDCRTSSTTSAAS